MSQCLAYLNQTDDHCCWLNGVPCPYLEERVDGHRFSCQLRRELGSWDAVHMNLRYALFVLPILKENGFPHCGDWPRQGETCGTCGVNG